MRVVGNLLPVDALHVFSAGSHPWALLEGLDVGYGSLGGSAISSASLFSYIPKVLELRVNFRAWSRAMPLAKQYTI